MKQLYNRCKHLANEHVNVLMVLAYAVAIGFVFMQALSYLQSGKYADMVTVLIYGVTAFFIFKTFEATRRTAKAAENAERAYVMMDFDWDFCGEAPFADPDPENIEWIKSAIKITPKAVNYGKSPATSIKFKFGRVLPAFWDGFQPTWAVESGIGSYTERMVLGAGIENGLYVQPMIFVTYIDEFPELFAEWTYTDTVTRVDMRGFAKIKIKLIEKDVGTDQLGHSLSWYDEMCRSLDTTRGSRSDKNQLALAEAAVRDAKLRVCRNLRIHHETRDFKLQEV